MNKNRTAMGAGVASIIIVFVALVISIFSSLLLLTVRQDLNSAEQSAKSSREYYTADTRATETMSYIINVYNEDIAFEQTLAENDIKITQARGYCCAEYYVGINDNTELYCKLRLEGGKVYKENWQTVHIGDYVSEDSLPIWDGVTDIV